MIEISRSCIHCKTKPGWWFLSKGEHKKIFETTTKKHTHNPSFNIFVFIPSRPAVEK